MALTGPWEGQFSEKELRQEGRAGLVPLQLHGRAALWGTPIFTVLPLSGNSHAGALSIDLGITNKS